MNRPPNRWHILGAGAIGTLFAAELHRSGQQATLLVREQLSVGDWRLEHDGAVLCYQPHLESTADSTPIHRLLVTTKAHQVGDALRAVQTRLSQNAVVVLLHNGLGPQQQLLDSARGWTLYAGTTTEGAYRTHKTCTVHAGRGESWFGPLNASARAQGAEPLQSLLSTTLKSDYDNDILRRLWQKLAINSAINGLTALHDCRNGELADNQAWRQQMSTLCTETEQLADKLGQPLFDEPLFDRALAVAQATAANYSSTLQDVRALRITELQQINGFLIREAERIRHPLPHHQQLLTELNKRGVQWATD